MEKISLSTFKSTKPMIYAYTTPGVAEHDGWTKIGYTEGDVDERIEQQSHTIDVPCRKEWQGTAIFDDGSYEAFTDHDFHAYLKKVGIKRKSSTEWFLTTGPESRGHFYDFKSNHGLLTSDVEVIPYSLRKEQQDAVSMTVNYAQTHTDGAFMWNAKPRFGKTLSIYDCCIKLGAKKVLIVTNRPAIANSWYSDYTKFVGAENGYYFVSETPSLKNKPGVFSREEYVKTLTRAGLPKLGCIEFVSLQDLKGSIYFGGKFDKLREVYDAEWDVLCIDEAHEGVDTYKTEIAFDRIKRNFTLHLSGTPFKALANEKFNSDAIFNWTYADEQNAKASWDESCGEENPYAALPKLNLFTYQMSEIIKDELRRGVEIDGETEEYAFDLNEFFATDGRGSFVYDASVSRFLDALTTQLKYPFSTDELRDELKHTLWILNRVDSAKALAKKLNSHPVFGNGEYEIVLAAGDGKLDDDEAAQKAFDKVKRAISEHDKTITLSVGQLTTGITIPEWTAVLMLSNMKSRSLYMQAAFRSQNPCMIVKNGKPFRKTDAYVFDFDPARTLEVYESFANDLCSDTVSGKGDTETRRNRVRELLNFFPVIGEDDKGEMVQLDAEQVLSIPRKIRSVEVVRRGFMSNYLFQNISNVFSAPAEVVDILKSIEPVANGGDVFIAPDTAERLSLNADGEVEVPKEQIDEIVDELFGDKIYADAADSIKNVVEDIKTSPVDETKKAIEHIKDALKVKASDAIMSIAEQRYDEAIKPSVRRSLDKKIKNDADKAIDKVYREYEIDEKLREQERTKALLDRFNTGKTENEINAEFDKLQSDALTKLGEDIKASVDQYIQDTCEDVVYTIEKVVRNEEKATIEDAIKNHLRGFTRTIPSFLMAYGSDSVTLSTFDAVIPDNVFIDVTSITLDQFRFLRDGGDYVDKDTGESKHFNGNLFDTVVFDDSVKEFLRLKKLLANYFDEKNVEDIFDYIPPQKTNQIFTPKVTVKQMVDMLEQENPGCFDMPDKTFIDMYMKSGMYITEIVKRLFNSERMKELFPGDSERLRHIFSKQVFGMAPTEIIYRISLAYILGFSDEIPIEEHNFKLCDAAFYAKAGTLGEKIEELFGDID